MNENMCIERKVEWNEELVEKDYARGPKAWMQILWNVIELAEVY